MMDRGRLYRYWTDMFCRKLRGELRNLEMVYCQKAKKYVHHSFGGSFVH